MILLTRLIQLVLIAIPLVVLGWLLNLWFVPSGVFVVTHEVGQSSPFIDEIKPETRVSDVYKNEDGDATQAITEDPAFFFLHPHRKNFFDQVVFDVWFQNASLPIIELGGLAGVNPERYTLYPLHNRLIDESTWNRIDEDGMVLLQREQTYASLADFFANPPPRDAVAVYRTAFDVPYRIDGYQPTSTIQSIDVSLRGHHELKTYIKNEPLSFVFQYMDMNRDEGEDVVQVTVFNENNQPMAEARASDDGNVSDDTVVDHGLKKLILKADGLPEGVYKLVMNTTRDIFFRNIQTQQQKLVFLNTLFIGDEIGYREPSRGATIFTESKRIRIQTRHAQGVQTITAGTQTFEIAQPYAWYTLAFVDEGLESVVVPVGDVEIVTEGKFAFSPSQYFNPDPVSLNAYTTIEQLGIDYVLAQYQSPRQEGDWLVATIPFVAWDVYEEDQTWKFSFSTPLIKELGAELLIHRIDTWFTHY
ncbi:hypothetical protein EPN81_00245 [Patescibacteria group bacterium]|nr:MAG: hypothetical protein EPN81_00245 [Patescibacteria group bacterium]